MSRPAELELDRVRRELDAELAARVDARVCGCGCGAVLPAGSARRKFVDGRHRQRWYQHRLELAATAVGIIPRLSERALQRYVRTGERLSDAPARPQAPKRARSPRPGVTIYLPTLELAEQLVGELREVLDPASQHGLGPRANARPLLDAVEAAVERRRRRA